MKIRDLVKALSEFDQELIVVMSKDGEGNSFSPLAEVCGPYMYEADSTWSGELRDKEEMEDEKYKENAVVLWPTN